MSRILFFILILLLPVQLGKHFWPDSSYVFGLRIDYLSPTLFLTDLLILGILGFWLKEKLNSSTLSYQQITILGKRYWLAAVVFIFLVINSFLAQNQAAAFYKLIKIVEFSLLGLYVTKNDYQRSMINCQLSLGIIYSSLIAIAQFIKQASLNSLFYWLGERTFSLSTPGIAKVILDGRLIMRPYGTFSHPNALAGFILVSLILLAPRAMAKRQPASPAGRSRLLQGGRVIAFILGIITVILSFSRSVWLVGILLLVANFSLLFKRRLLDRTSRTGARWTLGGLAVMFLGMLGVLGFFGRRLSTNETVIQRLELTKMALAMVRRYPLAGVGLNNFIVRLTEFGQGVGGMNFFQPVHNLFLLVTAETGLMGLLIFVWFLVLSFIKLLQKPITDKQLLMTALVTILLLGLVDHYWLTLQQTQLLLTVVLGLSWGTNKV